jgi:hypothetical protein
MWAPAEWRSWASDAEALKEGLDVGIHGQGGVGVWSKRGPHSLLETVYQWLYTKFLSLSDAALKWRHRLRLALAVCFVRP